MASAEISYISWNKKVQHILASTHVDGATVVWDLKKQRPVITLKDPNRWGGAGRPAAGAQAGG